MNGYTDFATSSIREQVVMVPLDVMVSQGTRRLDRKDPDWQRVVMTTGQSDFLSR